MRRALVPQIPTHPGHKIVLPEGEARHLTQVLRLRNNEEIEILDGQGRYARAKIVFQDRGATAETLELPQTNPKLLSQPIHLYMSIIKGDAMEWMVEKAVELGVRVLTPVETEFTVVRVEKKGSEAFQERWQKIADQALKQCGRLDRMIVKPVQSFEGALQEHSQINQGGQKEMLYWMDETLAQTGADPEHLARAETTEEFGALIIGPEGGFSQTERQRLLELTGSANKGIRRVHLGAPILRAETAALFGVSLLVGHGKR
ncbi:MAG: 16S rRNA (uracil(1498)-N(3))-methyltransferase [Bdellovibrionales bacterium]|nr:16S rRNA (uracil(1498)-N(3))-methyltransferase [Bdellovibrionales bacterium]